MACAKLDPARAIEGLDGLTLWDFWSWVYSDILSNRNRAVFAEFVLGSALGVMATPRVEWDAVDLRYRGRGIEVKSAAYVQSWAQTRPSTITFDVARKRGWDAETNTSLPEAARSAALYVLCLFPEKAHVAADILDIPAWLYYVLPVSAVEERLGDLKRVGLARLQALCEEPVRYAGLKSRVDMVLGLSDGRLL